VGESAVGVPRLQSAGKGALERAHDYDSRSTTREGTQRRAGDATAAAVIEECAAKSIWQHNTKVGSQSTGSTQIGPSCCSCSVHASRHAKKRDHPTFPECCVLPRFKMSKQRDLGIPSCHFLVFKRYWGRPSPDARLCISGPRKRWGSASLQHKRICSARSNFCCCSPPIFSHVNLRLLLALSDADVGDLSGPWLKVVGTKVKVYGGYDIKNKLQALGFQWKKEEVVWVHHSVDSIMEDVGVGMPEDSTISVCMEAAAAGERLAGAGTGALKQKAELNIKSGNVQAGVPYCTLNF